ncbi:hypothetical protein [Novosphingobium lentum]|uniref:hypothetical protein n=1 Tax=Novosphingobium lentum TaxID=145287 RepID=UPI000A50297E|nr:hypothetical protein [Novosphingobium lentum]
MTRTATISAALLAGAALLALGGCKKTDDTVPAATDTATEAAAAMASESAMASDAAPAPAASESEGDNHGSSGGTGK